MGCSNVYNESGYQSFLLLTYLLTYLMHCMYCMYRKKEIRIPSCERKSEIPIYSISVFIIYLYI